MVDPPPDDDDGVKALMCVFERFRRARMWLSHASDEPVALCFADDDDAEDWFAVVMGSSRIEFGVSMARGLSGRRVLSAKVADDAQGEITRIARSSTMIGFTIDRYALLPREQREQIERAGFRLRPEASAPLVVVRRRGRDTLATADDLGRLAHATAALLDAEERELFRPENPPESDAWRRLRIGGTWQRPEVVVDWVRPPASPPHATQSQPIGTAAGNPWCDVLGIAVPRLEDVAEHREANTYARLIVALLERGGPMTLGEVAERFEQAGIAPQPRALLSLKRCRPGRPPVFRDGDLYHVDPHDDETDLWAFRLGLRPSKAEQLAAEQLAAEQSDGDEAAGEDDPAPLPDDSVPLTPRELDEAWEDEHLFNLAHYVLVLAVLDAGGGSPRSPTDVVAAVSARTRKHRLPDDVPAFSHRGSHVDVLDDGRWAIPEDADSWVRKARIAVRERIEVVRRSPWARPDTAALQRRRDELERRREAHGRELAAQSKAIVVCFPPGQPEAAALVDVGAHTVTSFLGDELDTLRCLLQGFDAIGAVGVRGTLRALGVDPEDRRLLELDRPQKTKQIDRGGRKLKITLAMLARGSCNISRPFGDPKRVRAYLKRGDETRLRRRLEADAKTLYALYEYGRLHRAVRLRWGFLDEQISVPWTHWDEPGLHVLERTARENGLPFEVVTGTAPGWEDPWARARRVRVVRYGLAPAMWEDVEGGRFDSRDIQRARILGPSPWPRSRPGPRPGDS